jgi:mRNA interferase MazF
MDMVMHRGQVRWANLPEPEGSAPGGRRPVLIVSAEFMNHSRLRTTTVATITSKTALAERPGNVLLPVGTAGLDRDSVVNVSQLLTVDRVLHLDEQVVGELPLPLLEQVDSGLALVLGLRLPRPA